MSSPRTLGEYRIVTGLGSGGMARVYLGMTEKNGFTKLLVLKVLRSELEDPTYVEMFQKEAQLAARLNHPHVVQTYAFGEEDGCHYMAMEYLEGQALSALITKLRDAGGIPLELHVRLLCDALDGLDYAHKLTDFDGTPLGLVHRDISPQNIFVTYTGQAKVLDFGIAKVSSSTMTSTGIIKGKASYMAPEQFKGLPLDCRADVFAVGVMLWEAIANRRLVQKGLDDVAVLARRADGGEPKIREIVPDAPEALAKACDRALSVAPEDRFASAVEMREALDAWLRTRDHIDARPIASLMDLQFTDERSRLRKLVDDQLKNLDSAGSVFDIRKHAMAAPERADRSDSTTIEPNEARTIIAVPPRPRNLMLPALAAVGIGALAAYLVFGGRINHGASAAPPASAASSAVAAPSAAPRKITLKIDAIPHEARLLLDGRPLGSNPYAGSLPADASDHELRIEAEGYSPVVRKIGLDVDADISLQLEKTPALPASAPAAVAASAALAKHPLGPLPHPSAAVSSAPTASPSAAKPKGPLDWKDPWSH